MSEIKNIGVDTNEGLICLYTDLDMKVAVDELIKSNILTGVSDYYEIDDDDMQYYCFERRIHHYKNK